MADSQVDLVPSDHSDLPYYDNERDGRDFYEMREPSIKKSVPGWDMEDFLSEIGHVRHMIFQFREATEHAARLHEMQLNSSSLANFQSLKSDLAANKEQISSISNGIRKTIMSINDRNRPLQDNGFEVRRTQIDAVTSSFKTTLQNLFVVEKDFREKCRVRAERQYRIVKQDATAEEIDEALKSPNGPTQIFAQALSSSRQHGARRAYSEAQIRQNDIQKIEESILELAQMMNDMATIITEQDHAVIAVEETAIHVEKDVHVAQQETTKAKKSAISARKKRWWCFGIILAIIVVAAIILCIKFLPPLLKKPALAPPEASSSPTP